MSFKTQSDEDQRSLQTVQQAVGQISLFHGVVRDSTVAALLDLVSLSIQNDDDDAIQSARYRFLGALAEAVTVNDHGHLPTESTLSAWQRFFLERVLRDENAFTLQAERGELPLSHGLRALTAHDLRCLQRVYALPYEHRAVIDPDGIIDRLAREAGSSANKTAPSVLAESTGALVDVFATASDWGDCVGHLEEHIAQVGAGLFGRYVAFRWDDSAWPVDAQEETHRAQMPPQLVPIETPDLIDIRHLIDYEDERQIVLRNTERLLRGLPAQNVLLYGDRGTGKSATVKAMLHTFASAGLRMVEIPRSALPDLPRVLSVLRHRARPTILFIDDLSFEEGDVAYKELKAVLEGTLEGRPRHVLVYATSNRRHLIQEHFSDRRRPSDSDEVNPQDTLQEKLSLADRFGITVIFPSPDQTRYLKIVAGIAKQRGISMSPEDLKHRALQWATWHNGRSARTAQQFIDSLVGDESNQQPN